MTKLPPQFSTAHSALSTRLAWTALHVCGTFLLTAMLVAWLGGCRRSAQPAEPVGAGPRPRPPAGSEQAPGSIPLPRQEPDVGFVPTNPEEEAMMERRSPPRPRRQPAASRFAPSLPLPTVVELPELFGPAGRQVAALLGVSGNAQVNGDENSGTIRVRGPLGEVIFQYQRDDAMDVGDLDLLPFPRGERFSAFSYSTTLSLPEEAGTGMGSPEGLPEEGNRMGAVNAQSVVYTTPASVEQVRQFYRERYGNDAVEPPPSPFSPAATDLARLLVVSSEGRIRGMSMVAAKNEGVTQILYTEYTGFADEVRQRLGTTPDEMKERLRQKSLWALMMGFPEGPPSPPEGEAPRQVGAAAPGRPMGVRAGARHLPAGLPATEPAPGGAGP